MQQKEFLIIGQGLAGSLLAWELIQRNKSVLVVDNDQANASKVAAGLINPVTGKRLVKTEYVDEILPVTKQYYQSLKTYFNTGFYTELPLFRILNDKINLDLAQKRLSETGYSPYLENILTSKPGITSSHGLLKQKQTGLLNINLLLLTIKNYLIKNDCYIKSEFSAGNLSYENYISWNNMQFKYIIFCEGYKINSNPFFSWLPLKPVKGEMLSIQKTHFKEEDSNLSNRLFNYGNWLIPEKNNVYRVGATFDRDNINHNTTESAKKELISSVMKVIPSMRESTVVEQKAGIRPTTIDRQPMIGSHPALKNFYVFNGFGTKGSLLIPYYCQQFADYILNKKHVPEKINISRFYAEYFTHH